MRHLLAKHNVVNPSPRFHNQHSSSTSALDLEKEVGLPRGNIFHDALSWFFVEDENKKGTWGVETAHQHIYLCGSGAMRGGAVSGLAGRNAAMKILELV